MSAITPETIAVGHKRESSASSRAYDMSEWYDSRFYKLGLLPILGIELLHRAGCFLAPGDHPRHQLYTQPYTAV
ncbi:hypothetical protein SAMN05216417_12151, partial [Nitrosospira multiformis]